MSYSHTTSCSWNVRHPERAICDIRIVWKLLPISNVPSQYDDSFLKHESSRTRNTWRSVPFGLLWKPLLHHNQQPTSHLDTTFHFLDMGHSVRKTKDYDGVQIASKVISPPLPTIQVQLWYDDPFLRYVPSHKKSNTRSAVSWSFWKKRACHY